MLVAPPDDAEQAFGVAGIKLARDGGLACSFHVQAQVNQAWYGSGHPSLTANYKPPRGSYDDGVFCLKLGMTSSAKRWSCSRVNSREEPNRVQLT